MTLSEGDHGGISNDLADWFPVVRATGVRVPQTVILDVPTSYLDTMEGGTPDAAAVRVLELTERAVAGFGGRAFLRTGHVSGKHGWEFTCFVDTGADVRRHVAAVVEEHLMAFLPEPTHLVVRELLNTEPLVHAYHGMPVTRERCYFARDGVVFDWQPYWPLRAVTEGLRGADVDLSVFLADSAAAPHEVAELTALTEQAAACLLGAWSLDWLWTSDRGWVFIDAAHAEESYLMPQGDRDELLVR